MGTLFTLSIGYNSGALNGMDNEKAFHIMRDIALNLDMRLIVKGCEYLCEVSDSELLQDENGATFRDYAMKYRVKSGCSLIIHDDVISISCSGGGISRKMKEIVAMAFCREMVYRMNVNYGVLINLIIS